MTIVAGMTVYDWLDDFLILISEILVVVVMMMMMIMMTRVLAIRFLWFKVESGFRVPCLRILPI